MPDGAAPVFLAALVANCFRGALPPVDLRAVCLVLAIFLLFGLMLKFSKFPKLYFSLFVAPDQFWFVPELVHCHWVALKRAEDDDERQIAPNQIRDFW